MTKFSWDGTEWVPIASGGGGGGGSAADQFPSPLLTDGVATASSSRTVITATGSATPHTAGSWVQVDASLSNDASAIDFFLTTATNTAATDTSTLLEIGIGAAAAETVWATVGIGFRFAGLTFPVHVVVPGHLPAGTRVSVRARSAVASKVVSGVFSFRPAKATALGTPVMYGVNTATSRGVDLTQPAGTNTKSAWTEITAATTDDIAALLVCAQAAGDATIGASGVLLDIGTGTVGNEVVVIGDITFSTTASEVVSPHTVETFGIEIPAGTRISARWARAGAADSLDVFLVGTPAA